MSEMMDGTGANPEEFVEAEVVSTEINGEDADELPFEYEEEELAPDDIPQELWNQWKAEMQQADKKSDIQRELDRAMTGENAGVPSTLQTVDMYTHGTIPGRYYLIGAESGAGKTTIGDFIYIFRFLQFCKKMGRKALIFYCSFELSALTKKFRWMSLLIFEKYGVRLPSDYLQGRVYGKPLTAEHRKMADWAEWQLNEILKSVVLVEDTLHPTAVYQKMIAAYERLGVVTRETLSEEDTKAGKHARILGYKAHDPKLLTMLYMDHLALAGTEMQLNTKGVMDKMSRYAIILKNMFNCIVVFLQQFSTDMLGSYREMQVKKGDGTALTPTRQDFGDSKATYRDADVVYGAVKFPPDVKEYRGFKLTLTADGGLGSSFTVLFIIKNRFGPSNRMIPLFVDGTVGMVEELPKVTMDEFLEDWYDKAKQIEEVCRLYSPKEN